MKEENNASNASEYLGEVRKRTTRHTTENGKLATSMAEELGSTTSMNLNIEMAFLIYI
jgi:hypothetical protein